MPTTPCRTLSVEKIRELARAGAEVTLKRLRAEIIAIERTFPELALPRRRRAARKAVRRRIERDACPQRPGRRSPSE